MPVALERAIKEEDEFRKNLPIDYLDYMGVVHNDKVGLVHNDKVGMVHLSRA